MGDRGRPAATVVVMSEIEAKPAAAVRNRPNVWSRLPAPLTLAAALPVALLLATAATLGACAVQRWLPAQALSLVFLPFVLLAAIAFGLGTGLATAVASFLAFNFFFIPPTWTFRISDPQDILALLVFFGVALMTGSLAGRMREVADDARRRAAALQGLNDLAARLSAATTEPAIVSALVAQAAEVARGQAILLAPHGDDLTPVQAAPQPQELASADWQAARQTLRTRSTTYASAPGWPGARYEFRALLIGAEVFGVLGLRYAGANGAHPENDATLETMLQHAGIAIARTRLEAQSLAAQTEAEQERLRATLLSSLSHDLRTPLASILGAVSSLRELGDRMSTETRADLLAAIEEEAGRLSIFVANLLDMTRLESGSPDLARDWVDVGDCARAAIARARRLFAGRAMTLTAGEGRPLVRGDATLLEHVVFNLIDNAVKYSEAGSVVRIALHADCELVTLTVTDEGTGIDARSLPLVFDKHFRAVPADRRVPGTGLGLTICRGIVDALGGTIGAESPVDMGRGTRVTVRLPAACHSASGHEHASGLAKESA